MGPIRIVSRVFLFLATAYTLQMADGSDTNISVITCPVYELANGSVSVEILGKNQMNNTYPATIRLTCNEGYVFSSLHSHLYNTSITAVCQDNGTWTTMIRCEVVICQSGRLPSGFQPATWHTIDGISGPLSYRSIATMTCNQGYYMEGPSDIQCGGDGKWHPWSWGRCVAKRCNKLLQPEFGKLVINPGVHDIGQNNEDTVTYNTTVTIECNPGYILIGDGMVVCLDGWNGTLGNCSAIYCGWPTNVPHMSTLVVVPGIDNETSYNTTIRLLCSEHLKYISVELGILQCTSEGIWKGNLGQCQNEQNINPEADAVAERHLIIPIAVLTPLCLVLIVSVVVVCYRLHRFSHLVTEKHNKDSRNKMGPYDELKVDASTKVVYDELEFTRESA